LSPCLPDFDFDDLCLSECEFDLPERDFDLPGEDGLLFLLEECDFDLGLEDPNGFF
jgi:hypothetical protein